MEKKLIKETNDYIASSQNKPEHNKYQFLIMFALFTLIAVVLELIFISSLLKIF